MTSSPLTIPESSIRPTGQPPPRPSPSAKPSPSLFEAIGRRGMIQIVVLGALLVKAFWLPLRETVALRWQQDADWSHGWLVPLFSLYLLSTRREELTVAERRPSYWGLAILLGSLACYCWTLWIFPVSFSRPYFFVTSIVGLTLFLGGWQVLRVTWFPTFFLFLAIPVPLGFYIDMTMPLRKIASTVAAGFLNLIPGLQTEVSGVVIDYTYKGMAGALNVEQACSGMRLTMAFVTLGFAMAYLGKRPLWHRVVMVLSCIPIAVFCNILRVTSTGVLYIFKTEPIGQSLGFENLSKGTPHALLGMLMLPIALGLFALIGWLLNNLFVETPDEDADGNMVTQ